MEINIKIEVDGVVYDFKKGISLFEISKQFQNKFKFPILIALVDNVITELNINIENNCKIKFIDCTDSLGSRIYQKGLIYFLMYTVKNMYGDDKEITVRHSIDKGIKIETNFEINDSFLFDIKNKMKELANLNMPIEKIVVKRSEVLSYFENIKDYQKTSSLVYNINSYVYLYKLGNLYNYFYSALPINTSVFTIFDLVYIDKNNLVLQFPNNYKEGEMAEYKSHPQIMAVFDEYDDYLKKININSSADLNKLVSKGKINDIIRLDEIVANTKLLNIAKQIASKKDKIKIVIIAGPSSSGKTITSKKLSMFLRSFGFNPKPLSIDDYFKAKEDTPKGIDGEYDFEAITAVDLELFNNHLTKLLNNEEVSVPTYNFVKGICEYNNNVLKLEKDDILIIEGIHGLNEDLTKQIPSENKFKIYVAPLTDLNIDKQNIVSTSDIRLLRRIVRDAKKRGYNALNTIKNWEKVRQGEEQYIFPYQDSADCIYNTALVYEIGVLRLYVEPLLYEIDCNSEYYEQAKKLLNFLRLFLTIAPDYIPGDSILREFIGDSSFE